MPCQNVSNMVQLEHIKFYESIMDNLRIKLKIGLNELELEGDKETVLAKLEEFSPLLKVVEVGVPTTGTITTTPKSQQLSIPALKELVIKDKIKKETDWILVYAIDLVASGKETFTKDDLIAQYGSSNRKTTTRMKNFSANLKSLVSSGLLSFINDKELVLKEEGKIKATELVNK